MNIANLSETDLRYHTTDESFQRGEDYYRSGAVTDLCQRGNCICGEVEGNEAAPYQITIQFDAGGVTIFRLNICRFGKWLQGSTS